jgi:plasmid maintenance system killer protein
MTENFKDRRARQAIEGVQATADYVAVTQAAIDRIEMLKAQRVARDLAAQQGKTVQQKGRKVSE